MNLPKRAPGVWTTRAVPAVRSWSLAPPPRPSFVPPARATLSAACTMARTRCWSAPSDPDSFHDPNARTTVARISEVANSEISVGSRRGSVNVRTGRLGSLATMMRQRAFALVGLSFCLRIRLRSRVGSLRPRAMVLLGDGAQVRRDRDRARHVVVSAHAAGATEDAARLDAHALRFDVALDGALGEDLQVAGAGHVALDRSGDDDVGAAHAAANHAALADHHRRARFDGPFDRSVDAERALGGEVAADDARWADDVLDGVTLRRGAFLHILGSPCHAEPPVVHRAIPVGTKAEIAFLTRARRRLNG